jgi:hypothetical protein
MRSKAVVASAVAALTILGGASAAWADTTAGTTAGSAAGTTAASGSTPSSPAPAACDPNGHWPAYVQGVNSKFDAGDDGYYLWHYAQGGFGLRVSHPRLPGRANHVLFSGTITTAGSIRVLKQVGVAKNEVLRVGPYGHTLYFSFNNYGGVEGVDFATTCSPGLKSEMKVDGSDFPLRFIHLGAQGVHPASNPFLIRRVDCDASTVPAGNPTQPPAPVTPEASTASTSASTAPAPGECDPDAHWPAYVQGANSKFDAGDNGYYLWHYVQGGWGLRVSHPRVPGKANHVLFTGTVTSAGTLRILKQVRLEKNDVVKVGPDGHTLYFSFNNYGGVDGVDFATTLTSGLKVEMKVDGSDFPLRFIHLGAHGVHPKNNPFLIRRVDNDTATAPAGNPTQPPAPATGQATS